MTVPLRWLSRSNVPVRGTGGQLWRYEIAALVSSGTRALQALRPQRPMDLHQRHLCATDAVPLAQATPGPDQGQCGGGAGGGPGHHPGGCHRRRRHRRRRQCNTQGNMSDVHAHPWASQTPAHNICFSTLFSSPYYKNAFFSSYCSYLIPNQT